MRFTSACVAVFLLLLLAAAIQASGMHPLAVAGVLALVVLSAWRPEAGLLTVTASMPVIGWLGMTWASGGLSWVTVVTIAFLCGWSARRAVVRLPPPADPWPGIAALAMAMVVAASAVVQLAVDLERLGGAGFREHLVTVIAGADLLTVNRAVPALTAAALLLEGLAIYAVTVRLTQRSPTLAHRMLQAITVGAGAAAAVNILRVVRAVIRNQGSLAGVIQLLTTQRINEHYGDMNAAGSYFVLTLWIAAGMAFAAGSRGWMPACAAIALALWMTGSRTAILAGGIAAALLAIGRSRTIHARRWLIAGIAAAALIVGAATAVLLMPARGNQQGAAASVQVRIELIRTATNMLRGRPVFGIGIGEFYQRSGEFSSPTLLALFPPAAHENAHNNFLQILAELGVAGLGCFVWLLALAARRGATAAGDRWLAALGAGLIAFLITCLGGHPLLISAVAMTFWLALGVMSAGPSAMTAAAPPSALATAPRPRMNRILAAVAVLLIATIPLRARHQLADTNLEHVGIGLSSWHRTSDNRQYRLLAGRSGTVFVPADAGAITVPLRAIPSTSWDVELHLDGRLGNVVHVIADSWSDTLIVMPQNSDHRRFRRVDLVVRGTLPEGTPVLLVGKVLPH